MNYALPITIAFSLTTFSAVAQDAAKSHCGEMNVLKVGDKAPLFTAKDIDGKPVDLASVTREKQVVLFFYRGAWCPFCTKYMAGIQEHMDEIAAKNAVVIAVSPEVEASGLKAVEKSGAKYQVVHDAGYAIMCAYGTAYDLSPEMKEKYKGYGIDLQATYGNTDGVLPVPATYIIGTDGRIKALHYEPDYKERMPIEEILRAL